MKKFDFNTFVKLTLRRAFYRYPIRTEALREARIERGIYKCASCELNFGPKEIQVDHKEPVISTENDTSKKINWNIYIKRLFCGKEGLQILCKDCHKSKTYLENELRRLHKSELAFGKLRDGKNPRRKNK